MWLFEIQKPAVVADCGFVFYSESGDGQERISLQAEKVHNTFMKLLQNGVLVAKIVNNVENPDPLSERPPGILTHRTTYTMTLEKGSGFQPSKNAQYAIAHDGRADQSIAIIDATGDTVKYRHN
jgi:hypothetical protein